ncbi:MBL fold metallo-hydrolase [Bradyrhizobium sp. INPA01-394B]|uniref:MBL fold metallo-hydrolase n=1 Tax=Bradyrhizobium campsiandrae TaxID=1729892 RepID=A0ABR7U5Y4_9BRAD|nr:MBL fold metallo-hydrolase [Bradyrhizobium campsiandrae]MBC9877706.1 MBL fold metallo-hydrolase [Bradyrhizobium campsiandrae]MBC9978931.1 MBL fold metallo-hydrolase [Bradyrhizobium campsiandrae]
MKQPQSRLTRRAFCLCCVASATFAAGGGWMTPREAYAEAKNIVDMIRADAATATIKIHRLRGGVSVLEGSGGNVGVLTGPDGKVMIDAGITASKPRMLEALASLGSEPIRHLINTHWHFDHADGNEWVHGEGAAITAHENTKKHLLSMQRVEDWDFDFPALAPGAIPTETFAERKKITVNRSTIELEHYGPAHTDSDISVHFVEADILHVADTFWNGIYPFIDYSTGGSIDGMILAANANLAKASEKTIVIPGHGSPVSNRAELKEYRDMLVAIRDNVARLKKQERTLEAVVAAKPTEAFDGKWGQFVITPALFTKLVYEGV